MKGSTGFLVNVSEIPDHFLMPVLKKREEKKDE